MKPQQTANQIGVLLRTKGCKFASFTYTNQQGETAKRFVQLGVNLTKVYQSDLEKLKAYEPENEIEREAKAEMVASFEQSLAKGIGNNSAYTQKGVWKELGKGVRFDPNTGKIQAVGIQLNKTIIKAGNYPVVNSRPKTIAKNAIRKKLDLKSAKFRPYSIGENFKRIAANGEVLEFL